MADADPVRVEDLLEYREWVVALARSLCDDRATADDVAQDAWVAALSRPPRHGGALRAWFATLVRRRAANVRRDAFRRARREALPTSGTRDALTPLEVVERIEAHERVVRAVLRLEEPYRSSVVLRFYEGLSAEEIATRTGTPVETVRTRLKRALSALRTRLDAEHGGDRAAWSAGVALLAWGGAAAMKGTTKAGIAAALLALLGAGAWLAMTAGTAPRRDVGQRELAAVEPASRSGDATPAAEAPAASPEHTMPLAAGTGEIVGEVWTEEPQRPVADVEVIVGAGADARAVGTDERGRFAAASLPTGFRGAVRVEVAGSAPVVRPLQRLREGERRDVGILWLARPASATVTVRSLDGAPMERVLVEARRTPESSGDPWDRAELRDAPAAEASVTTKADGVAAFAALEPGRWLFVASKRGFATGRLVDLVLPAGARRDDLQIHLAPGHRLTGFAHTLDGVGVAGLRVWAYPEGGAGSVLAALATAVTDGSGRFEIDGLAAAVHLVRAAPPNGGASGAGRVRVPQSAPFDLVVDPCRIVGTVRETPSMEPVEGALVRVSGSANAEARSGPDGRYEIALLLRGVFVPKPTVQMADFVLAPESAPGPNDPGLFFGAGRTVEHDLLVTRAARLTGRVTCRGAPVPGATVTMNARRPSRRGAVTDGEGRYSIDGLPPAPVLLSAKAPWGASVPNQHQRWMDFVNGEDVEGAVHLAAGVETVHDIDLVPGATVTGTVRLVDGTPAVGAVVASAFDTVAADAVGNFRIAARAHGGRVGVSAELGTLRGRGDATLAEGADAARVDVVLRPTSRVTGRVLAPAGTSARNAWVQVGTEDRGESLTPDGGGWGSVPRHPVAADGAFDVEVHSFRGVFRVRAGADGLASAVEKAVLADAAAWTYEATLRLEALVTIAGRVVEDVTGEPVVGASLLLDQDPMRRGWSLLTGRPTVDVLAARTGARGEFAIEGVPPGGHTVDAIADGMLPGRAEVDGAAPGPVEIRLAPMHTISGIVTFDDGSPLVAGSVSVSDDAEPSGGRRTVGAAFTLEDGTFTVGYLPAGRFNVRVHEGLSRAGIERVELQHVAADTTDLRFTVRRALVLRGSVVYPDGRPAARATVGAMTSAGGASARGETGDDGAFELRGLATAAYAVTADPPQVPYMADYSVTLNSHWLGARVDGVRPPRDDIVLTLVEGAVIGGVVFDVSGAPVPYRYVRADAVDQQARAARVSRWPEAGLTDAEGRFEVGGLPPGTYRLVVLGTPKHEAFPLVGAERVAAGTRGLRCVVGTFATIAGVVVDEAGRGIGGASLRTTGHDGVEHNAHTAADGAFVLKELDAGRSYVVHAYVSGKAPASVERVASGTRDARLVLAPGLSVSGRAVRGDGSALASTHLLFATDASPFRAHVKTEEDGTFTVTGLLPGRYRVTWSGQRGNRFGDWPCGEVDAGATDVELRAEE